MAAVSSEASSSHCCNGSGVSVGRSRSNWKIGAIVAAAGLSSRMGAFKPLLPFEGATVIERCLANLRGAGASVAQTATGLVPGKCSLLEFKTVSPEDARKAIRPEILAGRFLNKYLDDGR